MKKGKETKPKKTKKLELEEFDEKEEVEEYEEEIVEEDDEFEELEEEEEEVKPRKRTKRKSSKKTNTNIKIIINVVFVAIMIILAMITIDVIAVARYDVGPFFTVNTKTYKDGGTKEYYGFGYKVINYNQLQGRKGKVIGLWNMKYSVEPTPISILDLALEFQKDYQKTSKKFYNQYLKVTGTIKTIDQDKKQVTMEYKDESGKYTLEVIANVTDEVIISLFQENDNIELYGTAKVFSAKTEKKPNTIEFNGCYLVKIAE